MDNWVGRQTKDYALQEHIGDGGFGAVYRAYQATLGREVAVKIIRPDRANQPDFIRRFEAEAHIIARLEHHHIVPLYDYWRDPDGAFLVMRWMRGGSLARQLQSQGALSLEDTVLIVDQLAQALHNAHRNGIIHRDIKPGNILLDEDSNAFLADFGIAKDFAISPQVSEPDAIIGPPDYLAPEQARSEPVTPQTDVYSLGVVLYEMLEGAHPFPGLSPIERLYRHLNDPLPALQTPDAGIRDAVNDVIQQATAKNPLQRFKDVMELAQALREAARLDSSQAGSTLVELLTPREQEVLQHIILGRSNREIADELVLSVTTVKSYLNRIYRKLNVRSRVQAIVKARELDLIVGGHPEPPDATFVSHLPEPTNPYKGLQAFQAADERDFFGRDRLIDRLLTRLQEDVQFRRFLAVVGPSGSGKSSVIKAGLVPALWRGALTGSENWYIVDLLPGAHPLDELEVALARVSTQPAADLREHLTRDERGLARAANLILPDDGSELLVVIDQFEEVFTLVQDEIDRQYFLNVLRHAVTAPRSRVRIVVTLRADHYDLPLQYPDFGDLLRQRVETVLPLSASELEQAIRQPATQVSVAFEDGLVSRIVSDAHYQPGALPLLQYALTELFERRDGRHLTLAAYTDIGGTGGALARRADEIYLEASTEAQALIRQMFLRLVTLGEGAEDTRRRTTRAELLQLAPESDEMGNLIDQYAQSRLLSLDHDPATRTPTVEVAHEAILREWERLRTWLNDSRDDIKLQRQLATLAADWRAHEQERSYLVRGSRLEQMQSWAEDTELNLTPLERDYLAVCVAAEARRKADEEAQIERETRLRGQRQRILQGLVAVFLIAAVVAGGLALFAFDQSDKAKESEQEARRQASIGLAALAEKESEGANPERGVLLALEALEEYPYTPQAQAALVRAVDAYRRVDVLEVSGDDYGENFFAAKWSPDGGRVVASGPNSPNTIVMWDVASGGVLLSLHKHRELCEGYQIVTLLVWSPSGDEVASYAQRPDSSPCGIVIWDSTTGETILEITALESNALSLDWSPDGQTLLAGNEDGTATLWNAATGIKGIQLVGHTASVNAARFSPDGSQIATASMDGTIRLWDAASGDELQVWSGLFGGVLSLAWSPDGARLLTGGADGQPKVWDVATGDVLLVLKGQTGWINSVDWSADGRFLATLSVFEGTEKIWDASTGTPLLEVKGTTEPYGDFSPDSSRVLTGQFREFSRLFIWDISLSTARLIGHTDSQECAAWSPDGSLIATFGDDHTARIWDPETGTQLHVLHDVNARYGDWSPDSTRVVVPDQDTSNFYVWEIASNEIVQTITPPDGFMPVFANWSPDGTSIAGGLWQQEGGKPIYIWDAETRDVLSILQPDDTCMQAWPEWSPDGTRIVSACLAFDEVGRNTPARVRDVATSEEILVLESEHGWTLHAMWSPDGKRILTTYEQGVAKIWDAGTGEVQQTFAGHLESVWGADWSPDGIYVVTGDSNGVVKIWHSGTGEEVASFTVPGDALNTKWSPDGTHIIVAGSGLSEPVIKRVWLSADDLIAHAYECCVTRELTPDERQQFGLPQR
jgi:WD40 repeat protein/serine/threonine protein kinase